MKKGSKNIKKTTFNDKLLTVLIILLIILTIIIVVIKVVNRNNLDPESKLVTELHNYFNSTDLGDCEGLFTYSEDKVDYNDIDAEIKACLAYKKSNIPEDIEKETYDVQKNKNTCKVDGMIFRANEDTNKCEVKKIKKSIIDDTYNKIFGKTIESNDSFKVDNLNICYSKDDYYYCGLSETFTYTIGNESIIYRVIDKAVEKGSEIVIYDYFIKINNDNCFKNYTTNTIDQNCTSEYKKIKDLNVEFMKDYGTKYKHTFKKSKNDTYYWVSSEPVK